MARLTDFEKQSFLKKGALFSVGDRVWLLWGEPQVLEQRPDAVALQNPNFFDVDQSLWILFPYVLEVDRKEWSQSLVGRAPEIQWKPPDQNEFKKQFEKAKAWIEEKKIEKIVPFVTETADQELHSENLEFMIKSALSQESGHAYGHWDLTSGWGVLGVTPESLLIQKSELEFETMALAGTTSLEGFERNPEVFINDPKEKEEHLKVVDDLVDQLEPLGQMVMGETAVLTTPHLAHLHTSIFLKLKSRMPLTKLVGRLHPTPALGSYPRDNWRRNLKELTSEKRGCFGAPFTFSFSCKKAQSLVAIRNLRWEEGRVFLSSGCGLVRDSQFEREWAELESKRQSVKKMLGIQ